MCKKFAENLLLRIVRWIAGLFHHEYSEDEVMRVLNSMDKTDPEKRITNCKDRGFIRLIPVLHKFDRALGFLNTYGYVCDTYFAKIKDADKNLDLQRKLCSVSYKEQWNRYFSNYSCLLYQYLKRWDLDPEVKDEIYGNREKYQVIIDFYERNREVK